MNNICITGNLVNDVMTKVGENGKKFAVGKIAVNQMKDRNGNERQAMYFDFIVFGYDAEVLETESHKGDRVTVNGRLEEDMSEKDGRTYLNKRINAYNAQLVVKKPYNNTNNVDDIFGN